jgi:hypothetical protein
MLQHRNVWVEEEDDRDRVLGLLGRFGLDGPG